MSARNIDRERSGESGQGTLEYILAVTLVILMAAILNSQLNPTRANGMRKVWSFIANQVSAACPGCPPPNTVR